MDSKPVIFSCIIPVSEKDLKSQKLQDLIASIKAQDFPQDQIEILTITEGDSESAKGIGIKRAKGEICAMFCADNCLTIETIFSAVKENFDKFPNCTGMYSKHYAYLKNDNSLNRYFSLIGNNDPIAFYVDKCDRRPWYENESGEVFNVFKFQSGVPSLGDNGFFYRRDHLIKSDIDNYYPMDNAEDLSVHGLDFYTRINADYIWHRTSDNLISFLIKRYKYARDLYSERTDRRWKMVDTSRDKWMLAWFIASVLFIVPCLLISLRGFLKIRDWAWFWHWPVSLGFLITYSILAIRNLFKHGQIFQCPQPQVS